MLEVHGLREAADFDVIVLKKDIAASQSYVDDAIFEVLPSGWFRDAQGNVLVSDEQLVRDPECHFYYEGIKFVRLEYVYCYKNDLKKSKGAKDFADLEIIREYMTKPAPEKYTPSPDFKRQEEITEIIREISDGLDFSGLPAPCPRNKASFSEKLEILKQYLRDNGIDFRDVCIANSAVLEVCGLRTADDLDVLVSGRLSDKFPREVVPLVKGKAEKLYSDWLRDSQGNVLISDDQLIDDPACHFWYDGMKFVRLDIVYGYKKILSRDKDKSDTVMIREYLAQPHVVSTYTLPPEYHMFIIWENGQYRKTDIIRDIEADMEILKVCNITWDKEYFGENLTRFYGANLPKNSFKEKHVGNGAFTLIFLRDKSPCYQKRLTTKGIKSVNVNMFDRKGLFRRWTGGGHKIHATNSEDETRHDLAFLFGMTPEDLEAQAENIPENLEMNTAGLNAWYSLEELFYVLGRDVNYVVLRNFEYLPDKFRSSEHGDIDLLVDDYEEAVRALSGKAVFSEKYRVHYCTRIRDELVYFDLRHVGDNYYCADWERAMLRDRDNSGRGFYIPNHENYRWSLMYHALIHKSKVSEEYRAKLGELFDFPEGEYLQELRNFLAANDYSMTIPDDFSVYANEANLGLQRETKPITLWQGLRRVVGLPKRAYRKLFR